ncbi:tail fiber domain-containing protein [Flavobacteriales bacterium]|nr:tail fiber domain-containing protein [Flavobacteriales bacterium]
MLFLLGISGSYAQNVGINTSGVAPDVTAMLDIESTTKGLLIPRMTTIQRNAIGSPGSPTTGLLVFDTDLTAFYYYNGVSWIPLLDSSLGWELDGNTGTTAGTDYFGTTDVQDVVFKTAGTERMRLDAAASYLGIGTTAPNAGVDVNSTSQGGATLDIERYSNSVNCGYIDFHKSRGATVGTNTAVQSGDYLMRIRAYGNDGTATWVQGLELYTRAEAAPSGGELATFFRMRLNDGTSGLVTRLNVASDGVFTYNQSPSLTGSSYNYTGTSTGACGYNIISFDAGASSSSDLALIFGRGTLAAHTAALSGDRIGRFSFGGYNTVTTSVKSSYIDAYATENFSLTNNGSDLRFYTSANSAGGTFERVRIEEDGDVGIGASAATVRLDVEDNIANEGVLHVNNISSAGFAGMYFYENATMQGWVGHVNSTSTFGGPNIFQIGASGDIVLSTDAGGFYSESVWIDTDGQVGIGTGAVAPAYRLEVEEDRASNYAAYFFNDGNNENRYGIAVQAGLDDGSGDDYFLDVYDGNGSYNGAVMTSASTLQFENVSDRRLKYDIQDASQSGLDIINGIRMVEYKWKKNDEKVKLGFIAQELKEVYPEMVTHRQDKDVYGILPRIIIPVLIKSMQEQQDQIEQLQKK